MWRLLNSIELYLCLLVNVDNAGLSEKYCSKIDATILSEVSLIWEDDEYEYIHIILTFRYP